jgi:hypothetical protein
VATAGLGAALHRAESAARAPLVQVELDGLLAVVLTLHGRHAAILGRAGPVVQKGRTAGALLSRDG